MSTRTCHSHFVLNVSWDSLDDIVRRWSDPPILNGARPTTSREQIGEGTFGAVFKYTVRVGTWERVAAVKLLNSVTGVECKTESEVATMCMIKERTCIPIPEVYLWCSSTTNKVGAPWILMEYIPGDRLDGTFKTMSRETQFDVLTQVATIQAQLFRLHSRYIGSIYPSLDEPSRALACLYHEDGITPRSIDAKYRQYPRWADQAYVVGPLHDLNFLDHPGSPPRGPYDSDKAYLAALVDHQDDDVPGGQLWKVVLDAFASIRPTHAGSNNHTFVFAHGDLYGRNMILQPSGKIVVVDWEWAAFVPWWLAATIADLPVSTRDTDTQEPITPDKAPTAPNPDASILQKQEPRQVPLAWEETTIEERLECLAAKLDDHGSCRVDPGEEDQQRFIAHIDQKWPGGYSADTPADAILRAHYHLALFKLDSSYMEAFWSGAEQRAIRAVVGMAPGNMLDWLRRVVRWSAKLTRDGLTGQYWLVRPTPAMREFDWVRWARK
ncbi:hypothetical protein DACRYDRAFT_116205 [Dacryopinax primogenitus]|uniref:Uncharacterized protein n=1 Tax=Dacryopinax primogenitus (strain DJM 731) TaxID=1858805 RepID=M5FZ05_DACPD|nr:uncharacterized protein DACRYDRAFT_116205 [Dacryopinax primogenitus]EJU01734.1 hypothetical protein DACRYDRAFT_116205 [Dacryopinax primogenitus]